MSFPIQPVGTKLIVLPLESKEITLDSGIVAPGSANAELREGKVVVVSKQISKLFKEGDIILYPERKGVGFPHGGKYYVWLDSLESKEEVWGVVTKN